MQPSLINRLCGFVQGTSDYEVCFLKDVLKREQSVVVWISGMRQDAFGLCRRKRVRLELHHRQGPRAAQQIHRCEREIGAWVALVSTTFKLTRYAQVRDIFERANAAKPCVLFFDEFDSIAPKRHVHRLVNL